MPVTAKAVRTDLNPLTLVLWLALGAGLIEGTVRLIQSYVFGKVIGMSPHVIWSAPLANLVLIGVPTLIALVIGWALPPGVRAKLTGFVAVTIAVAGLILIYPGMHKAVALFLAGAIGWRLSSRLATSPGFARLARRSIPLLAGVAILGGVTISGWRAWVERRAIAGKAVEGRLNVLLIILDTVRGESLSLYGHHLPTTPFLETFAREGARFDRAMAPSSWTLPSHASMFTGQMPRELKVRWRTPVKPLFPFIAETFTGAGYRTGGFIANVSYMTREHGLARGFSHYEDYVLSPLGIFNSSRLGYLILNLRPVRRFVTRWDIPARKTARDVNHQFLDWVDDADGQPFFAFLNYFDAHQPYLPAEPYRSRFVNPSSLDYEPDLRELHFEEVTPEQIRLAREHYEGTIAWQDDALSQLMDSLKARGLLDETLVIITSDHGEQFGEHSKTSHANSLYRQVLQVPLFLRLPGTVPGTVIEEPVSLVDLPRTMLELAQLAEAATYSGRSLARYWNPRPDPAAASPVIAMMYGPEGTAWSLMADGYHYIEWYDGEAKLFAMSDEKETRDLAAVPESRPILERFAALRSEYSRKLAESGAAASR